jgi:anti-sigma B factor antagonist
MDRGTQLSIAVRGGAEPIVTVSGELDICTAGELRVFLLRVIRRDGPRLTLDLGGVTFMDCAGINVLLATRRRAQLEGGWVHVVRASPRVRRLLAMLGLELLFAAEQTGGTGPLSFRSARTAAYGGLVLGSGLYTFSGRGGSPHRR